MESQKAKKAFSETARGLFRMGPKITRALPRPKAKKARPRLRRAEARSRWKCFEPARAEQHERGKDGLVNARDPRASHLPRVAVVRREVVEEKERGGEAEEADLD